jgi:hypothetical protein
MVGSLRSLDQSAAVLAPSHHWCKMVFLSWCTFDHGRQTIVELFNLASRPDLKLTVLARQKTWGKWKSAKSRYWDHHRQRPRRSYYYRMAAPPFIFVNKFHSYKFVTRHGAKHGVILSHWPGATSPPHPDNEPQDARLRPARPGAPDSGTTFLFPRVFTKGLCDEVFAAKFFAANSSSADCWGSNFSREISWGQIFLGQKSGSKTFLR